jgi:cysteine desulfurase/selenocysteine lyase
MAQVVGLAAGIKYLQSIGIDAVHNHEKDLTLYLLQELAQISGVSVVGPTDTALRGGTVSFTVDGIHPHDLGQYLDSAGIAVRTGHHCAWPLTRALGVPATTRASLYLYNDHSDIDALIASIKDAKKYFGQ